MAYLYYYAVGEENSLSELMKHAMIFARDKCEVDAFNCCDIMSNSTMFRECKFARGTGMLNFYMFNYNLSKQFMGRDKIGVILV